MYLYKSPVRLRILFGDVTAALHVASPQKVSSPQGDSTTKAKELGEMGFLGGSVVFSVGELKKLTE